MAEIRYVQMADQAFWYHLDRHLPEDEFAAKVRDRRGFVLLEGQRPVGLLRYHLFWDNTPFCSMLFIDPGVQGRGYGRQLMAHWEQELRAQGYPAALTSTRTDETAQHFYRKIGYRDCGCLVMDVPGAAQPMEIFFVKAL